MTVRIISAEVLATLVAWDDPNVKRVVMVELRDQVEEIAAAEGLTINPDTWGCKVSILGVSADDFIRGRKPDRVMVEMSAQTVEVTGG